MKISFNIREGPFILSMILLLPSPSCSCKIQHLFLSLFHMKKFFLTEQLRWKRDLWRSPFQPPWLRQGHSKQIAEFHVQMVGEAGSCGVRKSRGNSEKTNVKQGVCQGHITSSRGDTSFCSMIIPRYTHCQSYNAVEMGRWRIFLVTTRPDSYFTHKNSSSDMAACKNLEQGSSLFRGTGARSDMSSSLIMKKCELW